MVAWLRLRYLCFVGGGGGVNVSTQRLDPCSNYQNPLTQQSLTAPESWIHKRPEADESFNSPNNADLESETDSIYPMPSLRLCIAAPCGVPYCGPFAMALGTLFQGLGPKREGSQILWVFSAFLCRRVGSTVDIFDEDIGDVALHVFFHVRDV